MGNSKRREPRIGASRYCDFISTRLTDSVDQSYVKSLFADLSAGLAILCPSIWQRPLQPRASLPRAPERAFFAYSTNYLIDLEHAVIVDVEATTAIRQAEILAQRRTINRAQDRLDLWPARLAAETSYGSAENLAWLVQEKGIGSHVRVFDHSKRRDGTLERDKFTFDHDDDSYVCPEGKRLRASNRNFTAERSRLDKVPRLVA